MLKDKTSLVLTIMNGLFILAMVLMLCYGIARGQTDVESHPLYDSNTQNYSLWGRYPLIFEGLTKDAYETRFEITDPTADRTITFPNASGTVSLAAGGYVIYYEEGDVAKANNSAADLYLDFDATDFETAVVGNEVNVTIPDDGHNHTTTSISGIDISADTNLAGDTEVVLTGDALSIASGITRDSEWNTIAKIEATTSVNIIVSTEIDTAAEINALTTDADFLTAEVDGSITNEIQNLFWKTTHREFPNFGLCF